ncbi:MAG: site-specific integrase [Bacteroidota bacterium]
MTLNKRQRAALLMLLPPEEIQLQSQQVPQNDTPLWKHWQAFISRQIDLGKSPISLKSIQSGIRTLLRYTPLCSIEQANNQKLVSDILLNLQKERNLSASTKNTYLKNLNSYMIWLEKRDIIETNNLKKAEKSIMPLREQPCQTKAEIEQIMHYINTRPYRNKLCRLRDLLFIYTLCFTGARTCELLDMTLEDCYKTQKEWQLRISGRKQKARIRYYTCPQYIHEVYEQYISLRFQYGYNSHALFVSTKDGRPWSSEGVKTFFQRIREATGVRFSGHRIRRYVATRLNEQGLQIKDISRYLGHQRTSTTELYIARTGILTKACSEIMAIEYTSQVV